MDCRILEAFVVCSALVLLTSSATFHGEKHKVFVEVPTHIRQHVHTVYKIVKVPVYVKETKGLQSDNVGHEEEAPRKVEHTGKFEHQHVHKHLHEHHGEGKPASLHHHHHHHTHDGAVSVDHKHGGSIAHAYSGKVLHDHSGSVDHDNFGYVGHVHGGGVGQFHVGQVGFHHGGTVEQRHGGHAVHGHVGSIYHDRAGSLPLGTFAPGHYGYPVRDRVSPAESEARQNFLRSVQSRLASYSPDNGSLGRHAHFLEKPRYYEYAMDSSGHSVGGSASRDVGPISSSSAPSNIVQVPRIESKPFDEEYNRRDELYDDEGDREQVDSSDEDGGSVSDDVNSRMSRMPPQQYQVLESPGSWK